VFFLLRHGQTDWNLAQRLQGLTDIALNETGRSQARVAAERLLGHGIDKIIASPLSRARETAQIVGETLGLEPILDARLVERNFGLFEGKDFAAVAAYRHAMGSDMRPHPDLDGLNYPHDAEPLAEVITRVDAALTHHRQAGEICLFVSHGVPFRTITHGHLGEMYSSPNAAPVRFEASGDTWFMTALDPDNAPYQAQSRSFTTMGRL
jgi:broad specificity phosphatase PhoE